MEVPYIFRVTYYYIRLELIPKNGKVAWLTVPLDVSTTGPTGGLIKWESIWKNEASL